MTAPTREWIEAYIKEQTEKNFGLSSGKAQEMLDAWDAQQQGNERAEKWAKRWRGIRGCHPLSPNEEMVRNMGEFLSELDAERAADPQPVACSMTAEELANVIRNALHRADFINGQNFSPSVRLIAATIRPLIEPRVVKAEFRKYADGSVKWMTFADPTGGFLGPQFDSKTDCKAHLEGIMAAAGAKVEWME